MSCSGSSEMTLRLFVLVLLSVSAVAHHLGNETSTQGFISLDCGSAATSSYEDESTDIEYTSDDKYIDAGDSRSIAANYLNSVSTQLQTLRSFPSGPRNCYTLTAVQKNTAYLVRATFMHGDYDGSRSAGGGAQPVQFDLYIDVNFCKTVNVTDASTAYTIEVVVYLQADSVSVCLINTGLGTPFISVLELRPLNEALYTSVLNSATSLVLFVRLNLGTTTNEVVRYPADRYDRLWEPFISWSERLHFQPSLESLHTTSNVTNNVGDRVEAPLAVMQTAAVPRNSNKLEFYWDFAGSGAPVNEFYANLLFSELLPNTLRAFNIYLNGRSLDNNYTPPALVSDAIDNGNQPLTPSPRYQWVLNSTNPSSLPPILNALEVYTLMYLKNNLTNSDDVAAINGIRDLYNVKRNWMGDPCSPSQYAWQGLNCSSSGTDPTRIVAINLTGNNLTGEIPASLRQKSDEGMLKFRRRRDNPFQLENRQFTYEELEKITNNFKNDIGKGGFGTVYHGCLEDGTQVAVKLRSHSSSQGTKEFLAEAQNLIRIHHKNLVSLVGYCMDGDHLALVYEFMSLGTLQDHLRVGKSSSVAALTWGQRLQIAVEAAQGLEYLHKGCRPPLVHRDVKTTNILLSDSLEAKIADFGLSKAFQNDVDSHVSTNVVGTPGYLDPEYYFTYQLSEKSDVYSFGVVLLELITGQPPVLKLSQNNTSLVQWVHQRLATGNIEDNVDANLQSLYDVNSIWKTVDIAFKCTSRTSQQRPTMTDVLMDLKESLVLERARETSELPSMSSKNVDAENTGISQTSALEIEYFPGLSPAAR
ncbi:receptor-like serine threonine-protein kinase [Musa troglodytarum]|uniref:Receptor-like serine threonine-protein kinase n=1 Tax=Musa troglodytarum TaxID=320322 RepID=A0A9E7GR60_9LILI|nr:receptor-like serine threonine-protein kinase [Musa troglodytarum]